MSSLVQGQLNTMFKNINKLVYEVDGNINDIYYGKQISSSSASNNFMSHSFGYQQKGPTNRKVQSQESFEAQVDLMHKRINNIAMHFQEFESYYESNKEDLNSDQN